MLCNNHAQSKNKKETKRKTYPNQKKKQKHRSLIKYENVDVSQLMSPFVYYYRSFIIDAVSMQFNEEKKKEKPNVNNGN